MPFTLDQIIKILKLKPTLEKHKAEFTAKLETLKLKKALVTATPSTATSTTTTPAQAAPTAITADDIDTDAAATAKNKDTSAKNNKTLDAMVVAEIITREEADQLKTAQGARYKNNQDINAINKMIEEFNKKITTKNEEIKLANQKIDDKNEQAKAELKNYQRGMLGAAFFAAEKAAAASSISVVDKELLIDWTDVKKNLLLIAFQEKLSEEVIHVVYEAIAKVFIEKAKVVDLEKKYSKLKEDRAELIKAHESSVLAMRKPKSGEDKTAAITRAKLAEENVATATVAHNKQISPMTQKMQKLKAKIEAIRPVYDAVAAQIKTTLEQVVAQQKTAEDIDAGLSLVGMLHGIKDSRGDVIANTDVLAQPAFSWGDPETAKTANPLTEQLFKIIQLQPKKAEKSKEQPSAAASPVSTSQATTTEEAISNLNREVQLKKLFEFLAESHTKINFADPRNVLETAVKAKLPAEQTRLICDQINSVIAACETKLAKNSMQAQVTMEKEKEDVRKKLQSMKDVNAQKTYLKANETQISQLKADTFTDTEHAIVAHIKQALKTAADMKDVESFVALADGAKTLIAHGAIEFAANEPTNVLIASFQMQDKAIRKTMVQKLFTFVGPNNKPLIAHLDQRNIMATAVNHDLSFSEIKNIFNNINHSVAPSVVLSDYVTKFQEHTQLEIVARDKKTQSTAAVTQTPVQGTAANQAVVALAQAAQDVKTAELEANKFFKENVANHPVRQLIGQIKATLVAIAKKGDETLYANFLNLVTGLVAGAGITFDIKGIFDAAVNSGEADMVKFLLDEQSQGLIRTPINTKHVCEALEMVCKGKEDLSEMVDELIDAFDHANIVKAKPEAQKQFDIRVLERATAQDKKTLAELAWENGLDDSFDSLVLAGANLGKLTQTPAPKFTPAVASNVSAKQARENLMSTLGFIKNSDNLLANPAQDLNATVKSLIELPEQSKQFFVDYFFLRSLALTNLAMLKGEQFSPAPRNMIEGAKICTKIRLAIPQVLPLLAVPEDLEDRQNQTSALKQFEEAILVSAESVASKMLVLLGAGAPIYPNFVEAFTKALNLDSFSGEAKRKTVFTDVEHQLADALQVAERVEAAKAAKAAAGTGLVTPPATTVHLGASTTLDSIFGTTPAGPDIFGTSAPAPKETDAQRAQREADELKALQAARRSQSQSIAAPGAASAATVTSPASSDNAVAKKADIERRRAAAAARRTATAGTVTPELLAANAAKAALDAEGFISAATKALEAKTLADQTLATAQSALDTLTAEIAQLKASGVAEDDDRVLDKEEMQIDANEELKHAKENAIKAQQAYGLAESTAAQARDIANELADKARQAQEAAKAAEQQRLAEEARKAEAAEAKRIADAAEAKRIADETEAEKQRLLAQAASVSTSSDAPTATTEAAPGAEGVITEEMYARLEEEAAEREAEEEKARALAEIEQKKQARLSSRRAAGAGSAPATPKKTDPGDLFSDFQSTPEKGQDPNSPDATSAAVNAMATSIPFGGFGGLSVPSAASSATETAGPQQPGPVVDDPLEANPADPFTSNVM